MQSYNITGLKPYQLITVTVTATNGAGTSEPSSNVTDRTHEAGMIVYLYIVKIAVLHKTVYSPRSSGDS